ncbi:hypothetical protein GCM10009827_012290 [Dactylosporangium maewongense]|uniref:Uncharacterized protein n=1 Tax=Dactylosporangium maewongense TaxID=634393 RepID=A0ABN1ZPF2_9ACTN
MTVFGPAVAAWDGVATVATVVVSVASTTADRTAARGRQLGMGCSNDKAAETQVSMTVPATGNLDAAGVPARS